MHDDLDFLSPLSDARAADLVAHFGDLAGERIIDIGCGWAELLLRTLEAAPGTTGFGIDVDPEAIAHGQANAQARGLADRVRLVVGDASQQSSETADAVICIGRARSGVTTPRRSTQCTRWIGRGGRVLYGESIWTWAPTEAAVEALGGVAEQYGSLADLMDVAVA